MGYGIIQIRKECLVGFRAGTATAALSKTGGGGWGKGDPIIFEASCKTGSPIALGEGVVTGVKRLLIANSHVVIGSGMQTDTLTTLVQCNNLAIKLGYDDYYGLQKRLRNGAAAFNGFPFTGVMIEWRVTEMYPVEK